MKNRRMIALFLFLASLAQLAAQKIDGIRYITEFGLQPKVEKSWHFSRVSQTTTFRETPEGSTRRFDFTINWYPVLKFSDFKITVRNASGAVVDQPRPGTPPASLPAGVYGAEITGTYADGFGELSFKLSGLEIRDPPPSAAGKPPVPQSSLTAVRLDFNFPQVKIKKSPAQLGGKTRWDLATWWAPGRKDGGYIGRPILFEPGTQKKIQGVEGADWWGAHKPGVYDLLLSADISRAGRPFEIRLAGIKLEANTRYEIDYVLNGAVVIVKGPAVPHALHFYQPGTADKLGALKNWSPYPPDQTWSIEGPGFPVSCPPGVYDILYNYGHGARYEWRKGVSLKVGDLAELDSVAEAAPAPQVPAAAAAPAAAPAPPAGAAAPAAAVPAGVFSFDQGVPRPDKALRAPGDKYFKSDDEVLAAFFAPDRFEGDFALARLLTPATGRTKGESEVLLFYDNQKRWTPFVISRSRPARAEELKLDMLVLVGSSGGSGRRNVDKWFMGIVKDLSDMYKNEVILLKHNHDAKPGMLRAKLGAVRIIEEPVFRFQVLDGRNYMRVK